MHIHFEGNKLMMLENPKCSALCQLKQKYLYPKLFNFGQKITGEHLLADIKIDMKAIDHLTGKVKSCKHFHAQSYVQAFGIHQWALMFPHGANKTTVDILGANRTLNMDDIVHSTSAGGTMSPFTTVGGGGGTTSTSMGIVIGSGTAAVDISDHQLDSQLVTNISHGIMQLDEAYNAPDSATRQFKFIRHFTNNTGVTVNVEEIGLYVFSELTTNSSDTGFFMIERSLLPSTFSFDDLDVAIVGYTIKLLGTG